MQVIIMMIIKIYYVFFLLLQKVYFFIFILQSYIYLDEMLSKFKAKTEQIESQQQDTRKKIQGMFKNIPNNHQCHPPRSSCTAQTIGIDQSNTVDQDQNLFNCLRIIKERRLDYLFVTSFKQQMHQFKYKDLSVVGIISQKIIIQKILVQNQKNDPLVKEYMLRVNSEKSYFRIQLEDTLFIIQNRGMIKKILCQMCNNNFGLIPIIYQSDKVIGAFKVQNVQSIYFSSDLLKIICCKKIKATQAKKILSQFDEYDKKQIKKLLQLKLKLNLIDKLKVSSKLNYRRQIEILSNIHQIQNQFEEQCKYLLNMVQLSSKKFKKNNYIQKRYKQSIKKIDNLQKNFKKLQKLIQSCNCSLPQSKLLINSLQEIKNRYLRNYSITNHLTQFYINSKKTLSQSSLKLSNGSDDTNFKNNNNNNIVTTMVRSSSLKDISQARTSSEMTKCSSSTYQALNLEQEMEKNYQFLKDQYENKVDTFKGLRQNAKARNKLNDKTQRQ